MLTKILSVFWIFLGFFWLIKPASLRNRLKRKMTWKMRWLVLSLIIAIGAFLSASSIRLEGIVPKILGVIGMIIVIKAIIVITSKTTEKMLEWLGERPLYIFRIWAFIMLSAGVYILKISL